MNINLPTKTVAQRHQTARVLLAQAVDLLNPQHGQAVLSPVRWSQFLQRYGIPVWYGRQLVPLADDSTHISVSSAFDGMAGFYINLIINSLAIEPVGVWEELKPLQDHINGGDDKQDLIDTMYDLLEAGQLEPTVIKFSQQNPNLMRLMFAFKGILYNSLNEFISEVDNE